MKNKFMINVKLFNRLGVVLGILINFTNEVNSLKDLHVIVPEAVAVGDTVILSCNYDLENETLYSIRWYFEMEEFYRNIPQESPPSRIFPVRGVTVDVRKSNDSVVTLRSVTKDQSGAYMCEVSADAPLFHTESSLAVMTVIELPATEPFMKVYGVMENLENKKQVSIGDNIKVSCVSPQSQPPVNFTWTVNGIRYMPSQNGVSTLGDAWSELMLYIDTHVLVMAYKKKVTIRCETNLFQIYHGVSEIDLYVLDSVHNGKVSPTTDQRGGANGNRGDPDNSALTGGSRSCSTLKNFCHLEFILFWSLVLFFC